MFCVLTLMATGGSSGPCGVLIWGPVMWWDGWGLLSRAFVFLVLGTDTLYWHSCSLGRKASWTASRPWSSATTSWRHTFSRWVVCEFCGLKIWGRSVGSSLIPNQRTRVLWPVCLVPPGFSSPACFSSEVWRCLFPWISCLGRCV